MDVTGGTRVGYCRKIEAHDLSEFPSELVIEVREVRKIGRI